MLRSPFAQRFLLLFVLSAVVPASIFGGFAYYQVSDEIEKINRRDVQQQTKSAGLMLHEWLLHYRHSLDNFAADVSAGLIPVDFDKPRNSITIRRPTTSESEAIATGGHQGHYEIRRSRGPYAHEMTRVAQAPSGEHVVIVAGLPELITPYTTLLPTADYCYLDSTGAALQCSKPVPEDLLERVQAGDMESLARDALYDNDGEHYLVSAWRLFMLPEFGLEDWTILVWHHESDTFQTVGHFEKLFLPLFALTVSIGLLIGMVSIRRYLTPFRLLMDGSKRLANNDFDVSIDIRSGDEVEQLGRSFNHMAGELKKKFETLSTLSEIDRLILSSQSLEHIGETLLSRIDALISCDVACIWLAENNTNELTTITRDICSGDAVIATKAHIDNEKIDSLARLSGYLDLRTQRHQDNYLLPLLEKGVTNGYAVAIPVDASHVANFFIGSKTGTAVAAEDVDQLLEFTHRTAVALSNSVWRGKLYYQAHFDILTQLPNRRMFKDILDAALSRAQREKHSVGVLFIDLDDFKDVNDSLGHAAGDELLVVVADRLRNTVRSSDTVARLGGDEFVVIVPDLNESETHALIDLRDLGEKLLEKLEPAISVAGQEISVTASIGASFCPRDANNAEDLLRNADAAMYAVKERGRKGFRFYSDELNVNAAKKLRLRTEIANALERDEFELYYQPKVDSRSGRIVGCESLIRWNHPDLGIVSPGNFIDEIERSGAIVEVGCWSLHAAAQQLTAWHRSGFQALSMSTNLSPRQFADRNLLIMVQEALAQSNVLPHLFEIEITESAACGDFDHALALMGNLRDLGLRLCIDDFGTGHSSLQYLQRMPIEVLKIDRSFVQEIGMNERGEMVTDAIIGLGRSMELTIVAEGVETDEQLDFLAKRGCHVIQGYYYSRPIPAAEFEKLLRAEVLPLSNVTCEPAENPILIAS